MKGAGGADASVDEAVALQAAEWFFRLQDDATSERDRQRWAQWHAAHPAHAAAWARAQQVGQTLARLPSAVALPVLGRPAATRRRHAVRALAVLLVATPAGWLAWRHSPASDWLAEHRTATGEHRTLQLADGSMLQLDTASAVDVAFDARWRRIRLRSGAIHVQTAADPQQPPRPLVVDTAQGRLRALGTRFTVRQHDGMVQFAVFEGAVEAMPAAAPGEVAVVQAGQQARMSAGGVTPPASLPPGVDDWTRGLLRVRDMRLQDFAAELGRYRPGILRCDPAVAELRISGIFQLRDTTPVLDSLPHALPVAVRYRTPYWVTLAPPAR